MNVASCTQLRYTGNSLIFAAAVLRSRLVFQADIRIIRVGLHADLYGNRQVAVISDTAK